MKRKSHEITDQDYEMYVLLISKSRLKSSIGTSTLMAGFALVFISLASLLFIYSYCLCIGSNG